MARRLSVLLLALAACGQVDPGRERALASFASILATCADKAGELEVRRAGAGYWEPAAIATTFRAGDWIRTGAAGGSRLEFVAGARLELEPGAVVILDEAAGKEPLVAVQAGGLRGTITTGPGLAGALHVRDGSGGELRLSPGAGGSTEVTLTRLGDATELRVSGGEAVLASAAGEQRASEGSAVDLVGGEVRAVRLLPYPGSVGPPPDARLKLPRGGAITLRWNPVSGASDYRVQVARDLRFDRLETTANVNTTELSVTPSRRGMIIWRVAARDAEGRLGEWGFARRIWMD